MAKLEAHKDLGVLLQEDGLITDEQLAAARTMQATREKSIGRALVDMGLITEDAKMVFLKKKFGYEIVEIGDMRIPLHVLSRLTRSYAEKHSCVPLLIEDGKLVMAMEDPTDMLVMDEIQNQAGMEIIPVLATVNEIHRAMLQYPQVSQARADRVMRRVQHPLWDKYLHPILLIFLLITPLLAFFLAVKFIDQAGNMVTRMGEPFDIALYLTLSWALWAIILWEADGLVFGRQEQGEQE